MSNLDEFLRFNEKEVLKGKGKVSRQDMEANVRQELQKYNAHSSALGDGDE